MTQPARHLSWMLALSILATPATVLADTLHFTDWTSANLVANTAYGFLGQSGVSFSGGDIVAAFLTGNLTGLGSSLYTPPLQASDGLEILGRTDNPVYMIRFSEPVTDPVFQLKGCASTLNFPGAEVVKVSGEPSLTVSGSTVSGVFNDIPPGHDSNGTVQLVGTFTMLTFTAGYNGPGGTDVIDFQLGGSVPLLPATTPPLMMVIALLLGLAGLLGILAGRRRTS